MSGVAASTSGEQPVGSASMLLLTDCWGLDDHFGLCRARPRDGIQVVGLAVGIEQLAQPAHLLTIGGKGVCRDSSHKRQHTCVQAQLLIRGLCSRRTLTALRLSVAVASTWQTACTMQVRSVVYQHGDEHIESLCGYYLAGGLRQNKPKQHTQYQPWTSRDHCIACFYNDSSGLQLTAKRAVALVGAPAEASLLQGESTALASTVD